MRYTIHSEATTYTYELGCAPLVITTHSVPLTVELCGNALHDLWISVPHRAGQLRHRYRWLRGRVRWPGPVRIGEVGVMGRAIRLYRAAIPARGQPRRPRRFPKRAWRVPKVSYVTD